MVRSRKWSAGNAAQPVKKKVRQVFPFQRLIPSSLKTGVCLTWPEVKCDTKITSYCSSDFYLTSLLLCLVESEGKEFLPKNVTAHKRLEMCPLCCPNSRVSFVTCFSFLSPLCLYCAGVLRLHVESLNLGSTSVTANSTRGCCCRWPALLTYTQVSEPLSSVWDRKLNLSFLSGLLVLMVLMKLLATFDFFFSPWRPKVLKQELTRNILEFVSQKSFHHR